MPLWDQDMIPEFGSIWPANSKLSVLFPDPLFPKIAVLLPDRTVRLALSHLLKKGYVKKKVSIRDARQKIYEISKIE